MKLTVTSLELKSPWLFFRLSSRSYRILKQLKGTAYVAFRKRGFGKMHYTMSLWKSEEELKAFAKSGAHLKAMQQSAQIAREIRTVTLNAEALPSWKQAKEMLKNAKSLHF